MKKSRKTNYIQNPLIAAWHIALEAIKQHFVVPSGQKGQKIKWRQFLKDQNHSKLKGTWVNESHA